MAVGMHIDEVIGAELFERNFEASLDRCFAGEEVSVAGWYATALGRKYRVVDPLAFAAGLARVEAALLIARISRISHAGSEPCASATELAPSIASRTMGQLAASMHPRSQPAIAARSPRGCRMRWLAKRRLT